MNQKGKIHGTSETSGSNTTFSNTECSMHINTKSDGTTTASMLTGFSTPGFSTPEQIIVNEYFDRIEIIYKETCMIQNLSIFKTSNQHSNRVFKIIFSCIDGKWNKSERIYGEIIPSQEEEYVFE